MDVLLHMVYEQFSHSVPRPPCKQRAMAGADRADPFSGEAAAQPIGRPGPGGPGQDAVS